MRRDEFSHDRRDPCPSPGEVSADLSNDKSADVSDLADLPVGTLLARLAQIEDAIAGTPTFIPAGTGPAPINPDLLQLLARERDIMTVLRSPTPAPA